MPEYQYAIIVPAWNEAAFIESSIQAIQQSMNEVPFSGQLIVVDNNSSDNTAALAKAAGAQVVFEPINQISRARNAGAKAASAASYIFIDADSHINSNLLLSALDALQTNEVAGGGANIRGDRDAGFFVAANIASWNWVSRTFKIVAGCFVYTRADAFKEIGGFTLERFAGEELVFSRDMRRWAKNHGMRFEIITDHLIETSLRKLDWYTPTQMFQQFLVVAMPWNLRKKQRLHAWYDNSIDRTKSPNDAAVAGKQKNGIDEKDKT